MDIHLYVSNKWIIWHGYYMDTPNRVVELRVWFGLNFIFLDSSRLFSSCGKKVLKNNSFTPCSTARKRAKITQKEFQFVSTFLNHSLSLII